MAPDFGFIPDSAQRHPNEIPVDGPGDGPCYGGLTYPRRTNQAEDGTLQGVGQLNNSQILQHPVFDLLQAVVILIEDLFRYGDIDVGLGGFIPGQSQDGFHVGPDHRTFCRGRLHLGKTLDLLFHLIGGFLWQFEFFQFLEEFFDFINFLFVLSQFSLNRPHLLPQVIFPLVLVDLALDLIADGLFQIEDFDFPPEQAAEFFQPLVQIESFQDGLFVIGPDVHVGGNDVCQSSRLFNGHDGGEDVLGTLRIQGQVFFKSRYDRTHPGFRYRGQFVLLRVRCQGYPAFEIGHLKNDFFDGSPAHPFYQDSNGVSGKLEHLLYLCNGSHMIKILDGGQIRVFILLSHQKYLLV